MTPLYADQSSGQSGEKGTSMPDPWQHSLCDPTAFKTACCLTNKLCAPTQQAIAGNAQDQCLQTRMFPQRTGYPPFRLMRRNLENPLAAASRANGRDGADYAGHGRMPAVFEEHFGRAGELDRTSAQIGDGQDGEPHRHGVSVTVKVGRQWVSANGLGYSQRDPSDYDRSRNEEANLDQTCAQVGQYRWLIFDDLGREGLNSAQPKHAAATANPASADRHRL